MGCSPAYGTTHHRPERATRVRGTRTVPAALLDRPQALPVRTAPLAARRAPAPAPAPAPRNPDSGRRLPGRRLFPRVLAAAQAAPPLPRRSPPSTCGRHRAPRAQPATRTLRPAPPGAGEDRRRASTPLSGTAPEPRKARPRSAEASSAGPKRRRAAATAGTVTARTPRTKSRGTGPPAVPPARRDPTSCSPAPAPPCRDALPTPLGHGKHGRRRALGPPSTSRHLPARAARPVRAGRPRRPVRAVQPVRAMQPVRGTRAVPPVRATRAGAARASRASRASRKLPVRAELAEVSSPQAVGGVRSGSGDGLR
ncbi:hypothetical protein SDIAM26S_05702 [Streptomyces diastaticus subsp. diastaticus]